jgi:hypothetical protein
MKHSVEPDKSSFLPSLLLEDDPLGAIYRVIKKDGHNFVWLYFKIGTSDKYDVNCILLYS